VSLALVIGLSGCQFTPVHPVKMKEAKTSLFNNTQVKITLSDINSDMSKVMLQKSPWGEMIPANIQERYFAASGRECMKIELSNQKGIKLVCKMDSQHWSESRLLNQAMGEE